MIQQLGWTVPYRGVYWSLAPVYHRFSITETSSGFTVCDHKTRDLARVSTLIAARAWAGIRVNEQCVRHA